MLELNQTENTSPKKKEGKNTPHAHYPPQSQWDSKLKKNQPALTRQINKNL